MEDEMKLKSTQAALVIDENWDLEIHMPNNQNDDADTPMHVRYLTMLSILSRDEEFIADTLDKFHELIAPLMENEED
ncbi:MAG: hypothetical protein ACXACY_21150 [Candidatus Hodarchaeales archaeon]|jgi:hypothetical protein